MIEREPLEKGQRVYLETATNFLNSNIEKERSIIECEIIDANMNSAYAIDVKQLAKYKEDPKKYSYIRRHITQHNYKVQGSGFGDNFILWLTVKDFEKSVRCDKELRELRKKAEDKIKKLDYVQLRDFLEQYA